MNCTGFCDDEVGSERASEVTNGLPVSQETQIHSTWGLG